MFVVGFTKCRRPGRFVELVAFPVGSDQYSSEVIIDVIEDFLIIGSESHELLNLCDSFRDEGCIACSSYQFTEFRHRWNAVAVNTLVVSKFGWGGGIAK